MCCLLWYILTLVLAILCNLKTNCWIGLSDADKHDIKHSFVLNKVSKYLVFETVSALYIHIMNCKIDTFMRNFIIFIMTFFASNMTLLLSSKSFIRHSLKSNKDLNVNFSRNFQIGALSTYFDQPSKLLKSWRIYTRVDHRSQTCKKQTSPSHFLSLMGIQESLKWFFLLNNFAFLCHRHAFPWQVFGRQFSLYTWMFMFFWHLSLDLDV